MPPGTPIQNSSVNTSVNSSLYPLKSQIKRQKMIYHCKFGEFGILEGQFTEPSGVAVNAQNDIIVADTNNTSENSQHLFSQQPNFMSDHNQIIR